MKDKGRDERDLKLIVVMSEDYSTDSRNLGMRTFRRGECYQVCEMMCAELVGSGLGVQVDPRDVGQPVAPEREQVSVRSRVTRWFTSNGLDTHWLVAGETAIVPSNLAEFISLNGYGERA